MIKNKWKNFLGEVGSRIDIDKKRIGEVYIVRRKYSNFSFVYFWGRFWDRF